MKPRDFPEGGWSAQESWEAEEKRGRGFDDVQDTGADIWKIFFLTLLF